MNLQDLTITERIRLLAERRGLNQREIGEGIGKNNMYVHRVMKGRALLLDDILRFAKFFRVSLNLLVFGTDQDPSYVNRSEE